MLRAALQVPTCCSCLVLWAHSSCVELPGMRCVVSQPDSDAAVAAGQPKREASPQPRHPTTGSPAKVWGGLAASTAPTPGWPSTHQAEQPFSGADDCAGARVRDGWLRALCPGPPDHAVLGHQLLRHCRQRRHAPPCAPLPSCTALAIGVAPAWLQDCCMAPQARQGDQA